MPDFRLKVFHAAAAHLSFTQAASELFITQPAVTKHIRELETEFGVRLFERTGNKLKLTTAGKILLEHAGSILDIYKEIEFDFSLIRQKMAGQLELGASTTIGQYLLPPVLARFHQSFPDIRLSMINDNTAHIEQALLDKKIELGIVEGKTRNKQLKYTPFLEDEIVAIAHTSQRLAHRSLITTEVLKAIPLVLRERGSGTLEVIEHALGKQALSLSQLPVALYLGSTEGIKSYLSHANCLGFVSIAAVADDIARGIFQVIDIDGLEILRTFYFVHLQGKPAGLSESFMRFARQYYNLR